MLVTPHSIARPSLYFNTPGNASFKFSVVTGATAVNFEMVFLTCGQRSLLLAISLNALLRNVAMKGKGTRQQK